jgi:hypothetical protein
LRGERDGRARGYQNIDIEREKFGDERRHALWAFVGVPLFEH